MLVKRAGQFFLGVAVAEEQGGKGDERADEDAAHGAEDKAEQAVKEAEAGHFQHLRDEQVDDADEEEGTDEDGAEGGDVGDFFVVEDAADVVFGHGFGQHPGGVGGNAPGDEREDFFDEAAHQADERRDDEDAAEGNVYPVEGVEVHGVVFLRLVFGVGGGVRKPVVVPLGGLNG